MALTYVPWKEKHKAPHGFGTWCPQLPDGKAQLLLEGAVADPAPESRSHKLYAIDGDWCFVAQPTRIEEGEYHGYPVPGAEVPERILKLLQKAGLISPATRRALRRQTNLPTGSPGQR